MADTSGFLRDIRTTPMFHGVINNPTPEPAPAPTLALVEAALTAPAPENPGQFFFVGDTVKIRHGVKYSRNQPETEPDAPFCGYKGVITEVHAPNTASNRRPRNEPLYIVKFSDSVGKRVGNYMGFLEKELELVVKKERKRKEK